MQVAFWKGLFGKRKPLPPPKPEPWWQWYKERDDRFGDARHADFVYDADNMQELLQEEGIWFGEIGGQYDRTGKAQKWTTAMYSGPRHVVTVAPNRTGKGTCAIIPNLLLLPRSVICVDPKGQNAAVTARRRRAGGPVYVLNPFGEHTGAPWSLPQHRFNPLAHLSIDSPNLSADVAGVAEALIVTEGKEPHWADSAPDP